MRPLLLALALVIFFTRSLAAEFYVAPSGADSNSGHKANPFATIAHAVSVAKSGDTIWLRGGIYRESIDIKTQGKQPLTIAGVPGEKARIFGSTRLSEWRWSMLVTQWTGRDISHATTDILPTMPQDGHLFSDDQPVMLETDFPPKEIGYALRPDPSLRHDFASLSERFAPGDDASQHEFEWATAHSVIIAESNACPVHLKDLDIAYANNGKQEGVVVLCSPGSVVDHCIVRDSTGRGISICPRGTVTHCHVYGHGILGIGSAGGDVDGVKDIQVVDCEVDHNAWNNADTGWEAGGIKLSSALDAVVMRNRVHDNLTWGIWFDWQCTGNRIEGNFCQRNVAGGIFLEASKGRNIIANNICVDTRQDPHNDWGDGIFSHDSSDALVAHNLCLHNAAFGIRFRLDSNRKLPDGTQVECSRNVIMNNICAGNGVAQVGLPSDAPLTHGNVSDGNVLFTETPGEKIAQECVYPTLPFHDFASWQKLGFDLHSVVAQPLFRDGDDGDFKPVAKAPQVGLDRTLDEVPLDFDGKPRHGTAATAGPFETP